MTRYTCGFFPRILAIIPATRYTCVFFAKYTCVLFCFVAGADPGFFLEGGALVSCSTSTPINHIVFFLHNTSCIRKPQVISGGGVRTPCTLPLDPPLCGVFIPKYMTIFLQTRIYMRTKKPICIRYKQACVYGVTESRRIKGTELYRQQKTSSSTMELKCNFSLNQAWPQ